MVFQDENHNAYIGCSFSLGKKYRRSGALPSRAMNSRSDEADVVSLKSETASGAHLDCERYTSDWEIAAVRRGKQSSLEWLHRGRFDD